VELAYRNRPPNTIKAYKKAQSLWREFCKREQFEDGDWVNTDKLLLFTQNVVLRRTVPTVKKAVDTAESDADSDIEAAVSQ
jgi:hypothetical protein